MTLCRPPANLGFFLWSALMYDVLANGARIPAIGFGTYGMVRAEMLRMIPEPDVAVVERCSGPCWAPGDCRFSFGTGMVQGVGVEQPGFLSGAPG